MIETAFGPLATAFTQPPADRAYWVVENALAGGAYPGEAAIRHGGHSVGHLLTLPVTAFVNLTEDTVAGSVDDALDPYDAEVAHQARVVRRPIPDLEVPTHDEMAETLDVIDDLLGAGEVVYTHCWAGLGRTGTVIGCWMVRHGVDPGRALDELATIRRQDRVGGRHDSPQTRHQRAFVEAWQPRR